MSYFVYILECNDKTLYTGITKDITKRLEEHNTSDKGAKYTKARRPVKLLYQEPSKDRSCASKREYEIKKLTRTQKLQLIQNKAYQNIADELCLGELLSKQIIQSLWSGYGELVRLLFTRKSIIVKHVKLPRASNHPRGWNSDISHQRKLHSYEVEVNWYEKFTQKKDPNFPMPKGLKCFHSNDEWLIVMEDLKEAGFEYTTQEANENHLRACLSWLANFHAYYMGVKSKLLWEVGTYWHLDTRPDEFKALEEGELKKYAKQIDTILKNTKYQTFTHGDAKLANFCFNKDGTKCAAVDFQYVGHGCGMKDVIYFMSSAIAPKDCQKMQGWILDTYFDALNLALKHYQPKLDSKEIKKQWREMFVIAWADFGRFLKGWSPDHFKINTYSEDLTKRALNSLKSL
jgi:predicted GIY-YIG superfamily endonuclease/thiamine kinase-like enzyme